VDLGNEKAMYNIGFSYMGGECATQEDAEAMKWLSKAADRGYADAMPAIGNMIVLGRGAKRDFAEAVRWFRKGAGLGNAGAQFSLGLMTELGTGTKKRHERGHQMVPQVRRPGVSERDRQA